MSDTVLICEKEDFEIAKKIYKGESMMITMCVCRKKNFNGTKNLPAICDECYMRIEKGLSENEKEMNMTKREITVIGLKEYEVTISHLNIDEEVFIFASSIEDAKAKADKFIEMEKKEQDHRVTCVSECEGLFTYII